jgi:hypothetical protein
MPTDTERLEWYVRHVADADDGRLLAHRRQADRVMGVTAFGQVTSHEIWYWPMDGGSREFSTFREAIDSRMA